MNYWMIANRFFFYAVRWVFPIYFLSVHLLCAQGTYIPLGGDSYDYINRMDILYSKVLPIAHTSIKPYNRADIGKYAEQMHFSNIQIDDVSKHNITYLVRDNWEWVDSIETRINSKLKYFYVEPASFYAVRHKDFRLKINPLLHLELGKEFGESGINYVAVKGAEVAGYITQHLSFYTSITDNQIQPMRYVKDYIAGIGRGRTGYEAVPGEGYFKNFGQGGADYLSANGYVVVSPFKKRYLDIQFGYGKHFIGNGYRSLFLSDHAAPYLYLRTHLKIWRISYQSIFTQLTKQYIRGGDRLLPKKYGAFHHLNVNITHWLDIGFFESVIFSRPNNQIEAQYLNPIIFYRAVEHALGSPDNVILGMDFKFNIASTAQIYSQILLDELNLRQAFRFNGWWGNKFGFQLGFKYVNFARIRNLDLQMEFNIVRPYTYTHLAVDGDSTANYTHYNQELAHPLGANFWELATILRYQPIAPVQLRAKYIYARKGLDDLSIGSYGGDVFFPASAISIPREFGNKTGQGIQTDIHHFQLITSYQPWHNVYIDLNMLYRGVFSEQAKFNASNFYLGVAARVNMARRNNDF